MQHGQKTRIYHVNADFDLSLRPRPQIRPALVRQVRELTLQALLGASARDVALLQIDVPEEFLAYLAEREVELPRVLSDTNVDTVAGRYTPFGWNQRAQEINRGFAFPEPHPTISCIRRVNGRSFGRRLETEVATDSPPYVAVSSVGELEAFLGQSAPGSEWVVKAEYGNSALANRRLLAPALSSSQRRFVEGRLAEDDLLVVEPWHQRERDFSIVFPVPFDGRQVRIHETIYTNDGGMIGALFEPSLQIGRDVEQSLHEVAKATVARLTEEGYFGPVCVDSFTWHDGDRLRLRPLVDLNARCAMSDPACRLWQRHAPDAAVLYRFFNSRKLVIPGRLPEAAAALGERDYKPGQSSGILFGSPLTLLEDGVQFRPTKVAVLFFGVDRTEVQHHERWFRDRFEVH